MTAFVLLGVLIATIPCNAQDASTLAREHHQRGVDLFEAGRFPEALVELRAALQLFPSPNTVLYVARALQGEGHLVEAASEFDRAASDAAARAQSDPRYAATGEAARTERAALAGRLGSVRLELPNAPAQSVVRVDGQFVTVEARGQPIVVTPHAVAIDVEAPGFMPAHRSIAVGAGQSASVSVVLALVVATPVSPPQRRGLGAMFGVGIATGAVGLAAGGTFLGLAEWQQSVLSAGCGAMRMCTREDTSAGRAFETAMWVSIGVGLAALAVATIDAIVVSTAHTARPLRASRAGERSNGDSRYSSSDR
jgi:hypothetical protein